MKNVSFKITDDTHKELVKKAKTMSMPLSRYLVLAGLNVEKIEIKVSEVKHEEHRNNL